MIPDVAYSQDSVPFRDVPGAEFRFGKLVTFPFFGAGVVEIPPGGYKHEKNARAMHLCFFVHKGKVDVSVAETRFSVGPGGAFQVPRGTFPALSASPSASPFPTQPPSMLRHQFKDHPQPLVRPRLCSSHSRCIPLYRRTIRRAGSDPVARPDASPRKFVPAMDCR